MDRSDESLWLLDMSACEPTNAVSEEFERGTWTSVEYEIEAGKGRMLFCGPDTCAPPLTLHPNVEGWHHLFVGTYRDPIYPDTCLLLKLTGDAGYTRATAEDFRPGKDFAPPEMMPGRTDLCEAYWKAADLTGQSIVFHRPSAGEAGQHITNVAYVRLVPCSDAERDAAMRDRTRTDTRRLIANYDGGQHHQWAYSCEQDVRDEFQALRGSDFGIVLWGCARAFSTFYPSRRMESEVEWSFGLPEPMRSRVEGVNLRRARGFDPLAAAVTCAREIGAEIYPQVRMIGEQLPPSHRAYIPKHDFQRRHPEYRCITPKGDRTRHLSHAFPDVRAKYVQLMREWVEDYDADGVCIVFCRSWPYVLFEKPVTESFHEKHGVEMTDLDFYDERVLSHRASFLTLTLREIRRMLDEVGAKRGRRLGTCHVLPGDAYKPEDCPDYGPFTVPRAQGMDVETWVREGLVDHLVVHLEDKGDPAGQQASERLAPYVRLAKGTGTRVYADVYPRRQSADSARARALAWYGAGVDGLCFWDCQGRATRLSGWAMHRLLGHRDELAGMKTFADNLFRLVPTISLDGFMVSDKLCLPTDG